MLRALLALLGAAGQQCAVFEQCQGRKDWAAFQNAFLQAEALAETRPEEAVAIWNQLVDTYATDAGDALECHLGVGAVFYRLGQAFKASGYTQRAHNLHQLAMSMLWDVTRKPGGIECMNQIVWRTDWNKFMDDYLGLAFQLRRHEEDGQPPAPVVAKNVRLPLKIGVVSLCDYAPGHQLHGIDAISQQNRRPYTEKHGYANLFHDRRMFTRHPVWEALSLTLHHLENPRDGERYDWLLWLDCDAMFVDMERTLDYLLLRFAGLPDGSGLDPNVHFLISEDGRGLAGGNWMVRNSEWGRWFLRDVLGPDDESQNPFMRHDLRDQFSLLWHLVRPGATRGMPTQKPGARVEAWGDVEYIPEVRLVPQKWFNAYPWAFCRPSHHCFEDGEDFIVSFITLSSVSREMAFALLNKFLHQSLASR